MEEDYTGELESETIYNGKVAPQGIYKVGLYECDGVYLVCSHNSQRIMVQEYETKEAGLSDYDLIVKVIKAVIRREAK